MAAIGDANSQSVWSGTPFHLVQAGRAAGLITAGLPLDVDGVRWKIRRYLWNFNQMTFGRGTGGFQYSPAFLERLWRPMAGQIAEARLINCFQLYPPSLIARADLERWYFLDQTLLQLFETYGAGAQIGSQTVRNALAREREGYLAAAGVVVHSRWAADSVMRDYGIPAKNVHVVVPGANLDHAELERWWTTHFETPHVDAGAPLRLVFVGRNPVRKGLDRLLKAVSLANQKGANCSLRVIGLDKNAVGPELRTVPGVEWLGLVDKRSDMRRFLDLVGRCDVGCLLSRAEAGGIGLREYHALGLAVLGPNVGGSPDHAVKDAAYLVDADADNKVVADLFRSWSDDRRQVERLKVASRIRRREVSWIATVQRLERIFQGD